MSLWRFCTTVLTVGSRNTGAAIKQTSFEAAFNFACKRNMRHRVLDNENYDDIEDLRSNDYHDENAARNHGPTVNLAKAIAEKIRKGEKFCSFELFPAKGEGVYERFFTDTQCCSPTFYALTWHEEALNENINFPSLRTIELFPKNTLMHLTGRGLRYNDVEKILNRALELGIGNVFALQGDSEIDAGDFSHASDLVSFIRERYGQRFCICVAGYPEMHPHSPTKDLDLFYLKAKIDAGADMIITQFFFESQLYIKFVEDCRKFGINVPIIPGIFPFTNANLLHKMTSVCFTNIPAWMENKFQEIGNDDEAIGKFGIDLSVKIIKEIMDSGLSNGYHLYTLNRSFAAVEVFRQLNMDKNIEVESNS